MNCNDCGETVFAWQEYCPKCSGDLFGKEPIGSSGEHSLFTRLFSKSGLHEE